MRKRTMVFAAAALAVGLTACTPKAEETKPEVSIEETTGTQIETVGDEDGADQDMEETEAGAEDSTEESMEISDELLGDIYKAVKEAYGDKYVPSMPFDEAMLEGTFGLTSDMYDAYVAEGPMMSVHVETFVGVKAKEGKAADVAKALESYRNVQLENAVQYPMNLPKLEASQVVTHGDYVFFVMLGSADMDIEDEEAALESAKENNQIAVDVIAGFFK